MNIRTVIWISDELLIEYVGDRINKYEADAREERYKRKGKGHCYLFAIRSTDIIIDATETGNDSKFINHSCNVSYPCSYFFTN